MLLHVICAFVFYDFQMMKVLPIILWALSFLIMVTNYSPMCYDWMLILKWIRMLNQLPIKYVFGILIHFHHLATVYKCTFWFKESKHTFSQFCQHYISMFSLWKRRQISCSSTSAHKQTPWRNEPSGADCIGPTMSIHCSPSPSSWWPEPSGSYSSSSRWLWTHARFIALCRWLWTQARFIALPIDVLDQTGPMNKRALIASHTMWQPIRCDNPSTGRTAVQKERLSFYLTWYLDCIKLILWWNKLFIYCVNVIAGCFHCIFIYFCRALVLLIYMNGARNTHQLLPRWPEVFSKKSLSYDYQFKYPLTI